MCFLNHPGLTVIQFMYNKSSLKMIVHSILLQIIYRRNAAIYNKNRLSNTMHIYPHSSSLLHSLGFCYLKTLYLKESQKMSTLIILGDLLFFGA